MNIGMQFEAEVTRNSGAAADNLSMYLNHMHPKRAQKTPEGPAKSLRGVLLGARTRQASTANPKSSRRQSNLTLAAYSEELKLVEPPEHG